MRTVLLTLVALLAASLTPSVAQAGKNDSFIQVNNQADTRIGVIADAKGNVHFTNGTINTADLAAFLRAGGRLVNAGGNTTIPVKEGDHTVQAARVITTGPNTIEVGGVSTLGVHTTKGKTTKVTFTDNDTLTSP